MYPSHTQSILESHLPRCIAMLAHDYIMPEIRHDHMTAYVGHGELCLSLTDWNSGLNGACNGGHFELAVLMISRGANSWEGGLMYACIGGYVELATLMIEHGAINFRRGLKASCIYERQETANLMISHGAIHCTRCTPSLARALFTLVTFASDNV